MLSLKLRVTTLIKLSLFYNLMTLSATNKLFEVMSDSRSIQFNNEHK